MLNHVNCIEIEMRERAMYLALTLKKKNIPPNSVANSYAVPSQATKQAFFMQNCTLDISDKNLSCRGIIKDTIKGGSNLIATNFFGRIGLQAKLAWT
jgi:hypothetical protein